MTTENHMAQGNHNYGLDADELTEAQEIDLFKEWIETFLFQNMEVYSMFREKWHEAELFDFMMWGSEKAEFEKYKLEYFRDNFESKKGIRLTLDQVKGAL